MCGCVLSQGKGKLKTVVENRNIYEGQYMKVTHVIFDEGTLADVRTPPRRSLAGPAWMSGGGRNLSLIRGSGRLRPGQGPLRLT